MSAPKRGRATRRLEERGARKLVRDREKLFSKEPGGTPEHPIDVTSAAVIEVKARAMPCPQCGGSLQLKEHEAPSALLRRLSMRCVTCGAPRVVFFRVVPPLN